MEDIYARTEEYAQAIIETKEFQRLLEVKELIKKTLGHKIIAFKTAEAKYVEAKNYGKYHPDLKKYQDDFVAAKTSLYSEDLVKEYKQLETKIQNQLNQDMNELKKCVSNKFKLNLF
ncbi:hypothetical protein HDR67_03865 [bacterium]|nr:hypothetical protein [bacterium]